MAGTGREEIGLVRGEGNVWLEEGAPLLQSCAPDVLLTASYHNTCMVGSGGGQEKVSVYSKAEGFVVLFFTLVWDSFYVGCVLYIVDGYHYV